MSLARIRLQQGNAYPYDAPDSWWETPRDQQPPAPPADDWAHAAARGIIADLKDRRDIKHGFSNVDEDVREEIVSTLAEIIREAHAS